ncbi:MAG: DUF6497 family protein [Roseobacter sp.]
MSMVAPFSAAASDQAVLAVTLPVPSGQNIELFEVLLDEVAGESWVRFRFIAPNIGKHAGAVSYQQVEADFMHLCMTVVLPYMQEFDLTADTVAVSLLDRPLDFGTTDPEATQYIEIFRVAGDVCAWEEHW